MENTMVFDELQNELEAMSKNESSVLIRVTGKHLLWLLDCAKAHYKNDIELAKLQGRNDVLKEMSQNKRSGMKLVKR